MTLTEFYLFTNLCGLVAVVIMLYLTETPMTNERSIRGEYERGEIDYLSAIMALQEHCDMAPRDAEALVEKWQEEFKR